MGNYKIKIKVNVESTAIETRDLFRDLGFSPDSSRYGEYVTWVAVFEDGSGSFYSSDTNLEDCQELNLPQLRDLVVLHRNDVKDANRLGSDGDKYFLSSTGEWYLFFKNAWKIDGVDIDDIPKPIHKEPEQGLISGVDALRALADGLEVEYLYGDKWFSVVGEQVLITSITGNKFKFRLKPRTIKLELEIPALFEPNNGDLVYILSDVEEAGYTTIKHRPDFTYNLGVWRTEVEIKEVVAALRNGLKGNS